MPSGRKRWWWNWTFQNEKMDLLTEGEWKWKGHKQKSKAFNKRDFDRCCFETIITV